MAAPALHDIGHIQRPGAPIVNAPSRDGEPAKDKGQATERGFVAEPPPASPASEAVASAMVHHSEREAVFSGVDLFAAALAHTPATVTMAEAARELAALEKAGTLHAVNIPAAEDSLVAAKTVPEERETVASMRAGSDADLVLRTCRVTLAGRLMRVMGFVGWRLPSWALLLQSPRTPPARSIGKCSMRLFQTCSREAEWA